MQKKIFFSNRTIVFLLGQICALSIIHSFLYTQGNILQLKISRINKKIHIQIPFTSRESTAVDILWHRDHSSVLNSLYRHKFYSQNLAFGLAVAIYKIPTSQWKYVTSEKFMVNASTLELWEHSSLVF